MGYRRCCVFWLVWAAHLIQDVSTIASKQLTVCLDTPGHQWTLDCGSTDFILVDRAWVGHSADHAREGGACLATPTDCTAASRFLYFHTKLSCDLTNTCTLPNHVRISPSQKLIASGDNDTECSVQANYLTIQYKCILDVDTMSVCDETSRSNPKYMVNPGFPAFMSSQKSNCSCVFELDQPGTGQNLSLLAGFIKFPRQTPACPEARESLVIMDGEDGVVFKQEKPYYDHNLRTPLMASTSNTLYLTYKFTQKGAECEGGKIWILVESLDPYKVTCSGHQVMPSASEHGRDDSKKNSVKTVTNVGLVVGVSLVTLAVGLVVGLVIAWVFRGRRRSWMNNTGGGLGSGGVHGLQNEGYGIEYRDNIIYSK